MAAAYAGLLVIVAVIPIPESPVPVAHLDRVVHLCAYLVFAWLLVQALPPTRLVGGQASRLNQIEEHRYLPLAWMAATAYGVLMEVIQLMVPWRSADWVDVLVNGVGAGLGVWLGRRGPRAVSLHTDSSHV